MDIKQAAKYVNLSRTTLYKMLRMNDFAPRLRLSRRRYCFRRSDLDNWLCSRRESAA